MKVLQIFQAEDNPGDVMIVREALNRHGFRYQLAVAQDGEQALHYVDRVGKDTPCPDLLLIDLNLPKASGHEVLEAFRRSDCQKIPAIIVSSSDAPSDRQRAMASGANRYFLKPLDWDEFMQLGAVVKDVLGSQY